MVVFEEMRAAIEAAAPDRLATVASAMAQAYGAGGLTDAEYEQLDNLLASRRRVAQTTPIRMQTLATACAQLVPAVAPAARQGTAPARPHHHNGSRSRSPESLARRRRMAAGGYLPPALAAAFTLGEQAVLAVIALEVGKRGSCTLALGHMAALAGVCTTVAKRAVRQAKVLGLLSVEERRVSRARNDTNVLRVASREWAAWLRLRLPRTNPTGLEGGGGRTARTTTTREIRGPSTSHPQAENRPTVRAIRTTRPAARAAGA
ncbi:hypothetical protein [Methylobacterium sp.]|uniref:hypothetical protein n=1 Tax=Methylobacterium sp. TaxID=409 RepID=UPI00046549D2|nr:hypothetical protein [Methylobacterium sp.]RUP17419.1 MAG: hypothetical protein EKK44_29245 [Methylobacterium sp.]